MSMVNSQRSGCIDVFNAFMVEDASYNGMFEIPHLKAADYLPNKLIPFSKAMSSNDYNQWIHFYEDDYLFERLWKSPRRYLNRIGKFNGVILPDFSLYRDMPLAMQIWNIYRSRAVGNWLQKKNIKVIPNIRFGDRRTYKISCDGIERQSVVAVGTHGNLRNVIDREILLAGFEYVIKNLEPKTIIIYGAAPKKYFEKYTNAGINIISFSSLYSIYHGEVE